MPPGGIPLEGRRFTGDEIWQAVVVKLSDGTWAIQTKVEGIIMPPEVEVTNDIGDPVPIIEVAMPGTLTITRDGNGDVNKTIETVKGKTITTNFIRDVNGDVSSLVVTVA